jgi:hypothetical protein
MIQLVRQRETFDCLVACFSMVTGEPYESVRAVVKEDLTSRPPQSDVLVEWAKSKGYELLWRMPEDLTDWPRPPFCDFHICSVLKYKGIAWSHGVVLLRDGTVLDPDCDTPKRLSDYFFVNWMCGFRLPTT